MISTETFNEIRECACEAWLEVGLDRDEHELVEIIGICSQKIADLRATAPSIPLEGTE